MFEQQFRKRIGRATTRRGLGSFSIPQWREDV
jgi:hypothetical protein